MKRVEYTKGNKLGNCIFLEDIELNFHTSINIKKQYNRRFAKFKCNCGKEFECNLDSIKSGKTKSCGCLHKESLKLNPHRKTHGLKYHPLYRVWNNMMSRCNNSKCKNYFNYGGRGIKVCDRWHEVINFVEDMSLTYIKGFELDRIDNNGNYEPSNCRWITHKENNNNRRDNRYIEYNGQIKTMKEWAEYLNINYFTLKRRMNALSTEEALFGKFTRRKRIKK